MTDKRPTFSIVTAVYDVEPYLPDFIASIEAQTFGLDGIEVIAVDDGSTDGSLALLEAWALRQPDLVKVSSQANAGQGSARNAGLERATGEWVTFTDPDDMLDPDFFAVADRFASTHPRVEVLAPKPLLLQERLGRIADKHPRSRQYVTGDRKVDLDADPNRFLGVSAGSLFRLDRIRDLGLRFDTRIRPNFEDAHFAVRYLLSLPRPVVGFLREAIYVYRKRAAGDSTLQRSFSDPGRFTDVLRLGYLDVIERAIARHGSIPPWLQNLLVYELSWLLSADEDPSTEIRIDPDLVPTFHALFAEVLGHLDPAVVEAHTARTLKPVWRDILAHACRPTDWHPSAVDRTKVDREMGLQRISYRYAGAAPACEFRANGMVIAPAFDKIVAHTYYGQALLHERIAWLPEGRTLEAWLDGKRTRILDASDPSRAPAKASGARAGRGRRPSIRALVSRGRRRARALSGDITSMATRWLAGRAPFGQMFDGAWVLMDRVDNADDNGERLFDYLTAERPDINAWFVLESGTPDWQRLKAARVKHLVAYGSFRWTMLMLNCSWLLSSHADVAITDPPRMRRLIGRPTWKFGFLQHGVIKDDLSQWLNRKDIDFFVVSTAAELESIVADGTGYLVTDKETRNTGLPRFDRLLALGRRTPPAQRDLILVAPTWRQYLTAPASPTVRQRDIIDTFWESDYLREWRAVLTSGPVAEAAARRGWRIGFMPHPMLQHVLPDIDLPAHIEPLSFADNDAQALYARCALMVTDYSSVAFNAAYVDAPVVYFQFDSDLVLGGAHLGRRGYFDYHRDGFGPVSETADEAVSAILAAIDAGPRPSPEYQARIDATFPTRDGRSCARVVAAVEQLSRPHPTASTRGPGYSTESGPTRPESVGAGRARGGLRAMNR